MPSLLSLPLELRLDIINKVIKSSTNTPPNDEKDASPRAIFKCNAGCRTSGGSLFDLNKYLIDPGRSRCNVSGLLLTNRQLRTETLSRLPSSDGPNTTIEYALDVMVVSTKELWPTWSYLPIPTRHINTLSITFRIFGQSEGLPAQTGRFPHTDYQRELFWAFYGVLERFLRVGPEVKGQVGELTPTDRRITVRTLNLEIPGGQGDGVREELAIDGLSTCVMSSKELFLALESQRIVLSRGAGRGFPHAEVVFERVGDIRWTIDGVIMKESQGELSTGILEEHIEYWTTNLDKPWETTRDRQEKELKIREWSERLAFRKHNLPDRRPRDWDTFL